VSDVEARVRALLGDDFETPLYFYDLEVIRQNARELRAALPREARLYYSVKANPHPAIVREPSNEGASSEISSIGELRVALEAGVSASDCLYTGPGKSVVELATATRAGVRLFSVESLAELDRLARVNGGESAAIVRVNGTRPRVHAGLAMTGVPSQFGCELSFLLNNVERFRAANVPVLGVHWFNATNLNSVDDLSVAFATALHDTAALAQAGFPMEFVDLGGGFGARFAVFAEPIRLGGLREQIVSSLDACIPSWTRARPQVAFESGRYLVAGAGTLLLRVEDVKISGGKTFVVLDGGINVLGGLMSLGRIRPAPVSIASASAAAPESLTLTGPLCTPADVLARDVRVAPPARGDIVWIPNVGAYAATASLLAFLSRPGPTELVVDGELVVSYTRLNIFRTPLGRASTDASAAFVPPS